MESNEIMTASNATLLEQVVVNGDLAKLTAQQRLDYYRQVCQSMGLNPLSKPFDYINLNGKLTLYAKKDATDQLRKINGVSIDDVKTDDEGDWFVVTVKGSDKTGRRDVEIGAVAKNDMRGNYGNALMKAVTKAKRRLTLSLCGLGWLDETEVETIPDAQTVVVDQNTGEIIEPASKVLKNQQKQRPPFDETEYLKNFVANDKLPYIAPANAKTITNSEGKPYGDLTTKELSWNLFGCQKKLQKADLTDDERTMILHKMSAIQTVLSDRKAQLLVKEASEASAYA